MSQEVAFPDADVEAETETITREESERLREIETAIERAGRRFARDTYPLLLEVHDRKLFRARYKSFSSYCLNRWGWTARSTVYYHLGQAKEQAALKARAEANGASPAAQRATEEATRDASSGRDRRHQKVREQNTKSPGQRSPASRTFEPKATRPAPGSPKPEAATGADRVLSRAIGLLSTIGTGKSWARTTTRPQLLASLVAATETWISDAREGLDKRGIEV